MRAVEFLVQLNGEPVLRLPDEIARGLPRSGSARVIVLTDAEPASEPWHRIAEPALAAAYGDAEPNYFDTDIKP